MPRSESDLSSGCTECGKSCAPGEYHTYLHCVVYKWEHGGNGLRVKEIDALVRHAKSSPIWKGAEHGTAI